MEKESEKGAIRLRTVVEFLFIFLLAYFVIQVAPVIVLRVKFLNELEVLANSPVEESAADIRAEIMDVAEGYGITVLSEGVHAQRDLAQKKTIIDVRYQLHINFWPRFTYVWDIHDHVEGLLF